MYFLNAETWRADIDDAPKQFCKGMIAITHKLLRVQCVTHELQFLQCSKSDVPLYHLSLTFCVSSLLLLPSFNSSVFSILLFP
jgi:hypothetical protein